MFFNEKLTWFLLDFTDSVCVDGLTEYLASLTISLYFKTRKTTQIFVMFKF